jgi:nucleotide-binding universal stress UspA family protein
MNTCLAAVDFSGITTDVTRFAVLIAGAMKARLTLLHVVELPPLREPGSDVVIHSATVDPPDLNHVRKQLEQIAEPLRANGLRVDTVVAVGNPSAEILRLAQSSKACMILLGSRGHGIISQTLFGSVVTSVLKKSPVPVTVVPIHAKQVHALQPA